MYHSVLWFQASTKQWIEVKLDEDKLLGRACTEFDALSHGIALLEDVRLGNFIVIAFTGACDTSTYYAFGDGVGRDLSVV